MNFKNLGCRYQGYLNLHVSSIHAKLNDTRKFNNSELKVPYLKNEDNNYYLNEAIERSKGIQDLK